MSDTLSIYEQVDYYALLNVPDTATIEEIKAAYFKHSLAFHPDKVSKEFRDDATECIAELNTAYEVLSDKRKRKLYDFYNVSGVNLLRLLVSHHGVDEKEDAFGDVVWKVREFVNEEWVMMGGEGMKNAQNIVVWIDGTDTLRTQNKPDIYAFTFGQSYVIDVTEKFKFAIGNKMEMNRVMQGQAMFYLSQQYEYSNYTNFSSQVSQSIYDPDSLSLKVGVQRKISDQLSIKESLIFQRDKTIQLGLDFDSDLFLFGKPWSLNNSLTFGNDVSVTTSVGYSPPTGDDGTGMTVFGTITSYTVRLGYQIYKEIQGKYSMALTNYFSPNEISCKLYAYRKFSFIGRLGLGIQYSNSDGTWLSVGWSVSRDRTITVPIQLFQKLSLESVVTSTVIGLIFGIIGNKFVLEPVEKKALKWSKEGKTFFKKNLENRNKALQQQEKINSIIEGLIACERDGLIIIQALYGNLKKDPAFVDVDHREVNIEEIPAYSKTNTEIFNVTTALQFYVEDSQLNLTKHTKSTLLGFYDPCPLEDKKLDIIYSYKGTTYQVIFSDEDPLRIPK